MQGRRINLTLKFSYFKIFSSYLQFNPTYQTTNLSTYLLNIAATFLSTYRSYYYLTLYSLHTFLPGLLDNLPT